jgi:hypothetical protein
MWLASQNLREYKASPANGARVAIAYQGYNFLTKARRHGLVVKADGSWPRGLGFKPGHSILDGCKRFASYYIKEKLKIEVAKWGTPKKYLKKNFHTEESIRLLQPRLLQPLLLQPRLKQLRFDKCGCGALVAHTYGSTKRRSGFDSQPDPGGFFWKSLILWFGLTNWYRSNFLQIKIHVFTKLLYDSHNISCGSWIWLILKG